MCSLFRFLLLFLGFCAGKIVLDYGVHDALDLILLGDLLVLESKSPVNAHLANSVASEDDWGRRCELDDRPWGVVWFCATRKHIEMGQLGLQDIPLEVPHLYTAIVCHTSKDRGGLRRPADIIDLSLEGVVA